MKKNKIFNQETCIKLFKRMNKKKIKNKNKWDKLKPNTKTGVLTQTNPLLILYVWIKILHEKAKIVRPDDEVRPHYMLLIRNTLKKKDIVAETKMLKITYYENTKLK